MNMRRGEDFILLDQSLDLSCKLFFPESLTLLFVGDIEVWKNTMLTFYGYNLWGRMGMRRIGTHESSGGM